MLSSRHQSVLKEIDAARCVGSWSTVSALAAKLLKHGSPGHVFASIVGSEAELEEYLAKVEWSPQEHWSDDGMMQRSSDGVRVTARYPMNISSSPKQLEALEKRLQKIGKHTLSDEEAYQLSVVMAKVYFYGCKFEQCQAAVDSLATTIPDEGAVSPVYVRQLYMAQMVMRGITAEMHGDMDTAHSMYDTALAALKERLSSQAALVVPRGSAAGTEKSLEELVNWAEEALYRRAMASLAQDNIDRGTDELAVYIRVMDNVTPATFRVFRRLRANRLHMQLERQSIGTDASAAALAKERVLTSHRRQMALLKATYAFPRANEAHAEVLAEVDGAARDWELVRAFSRVESLRLLEVLYEAVYLTFNSPQVLRHLVHVLVRFGDYHEARLAFVTYRELVERQLERVKKALGTGSTIDGGLESVNNILRTVVVGARLFFVHLDSAHECLSVVHFANDLIDDVEARDPDHRIIPPVPETIRAQVALWKGAAHGRLAQRSREPSNRADHHCAALQLLRQAAELNPQLYEAHYFLALELALGARDIAAATAAAKQAAALDATRLDAWHLLVLLSTARKDYAKALQICEVAMRQSVWWPAYNEAQPDVNKSSESVTHSQALHEASAKVPLGSVDAGMDFFGLAMTHMAIEGRHRGFDASLDAQPRLFALYANVFGSVVAAGDESDDVASAMEAAGISIGSLTVGDLRTGHHTHVNHLVPSQASGRPSLARSLARSVFSKHTRFSSHGEYPPLPFSASDGAGEAADVPKLPDHPGQSDQPKRQRSMPHLRAPSGDGSVLSADIPTEAFFDKHGGGRSSTVTHMHSNRSVYSTAVATRQNHQRAQARRALCSLWLATGTAFVALQRLDEAGGAVAEALAAWPESPEALTMRGQLAAAEAQHVTALNEFHAAVALEANNIRAAVALARVEHELGRRDVALGLLKNITRAHGWCDPEAWYWLGRLEHELALECDSDACSQMLRRALKYSSYALELESSQPVRPFSILRP
ncbi:hypothetical protein IW147_003238 [Coemansia sp. RSA 720]|nr:hypothetical protein IW147_003238 [Coemansia sp. RSA 720]